MFRGGLGSRFARTPALRGPIRRPGPRPGSSRVGGPPPLLRVPAPVGRALARWLGLRESGVRALRGRFYRLARPGSSRVCRVTRLRP